MITDSNTKAVDAYIQQFPEPLQKRMESLRALIKSVIPEAIEDISYQMPAYRMQPGKRAFVYFGVAKTHIGLYALHFGISPELQKEAAPYLTTKSTMNLANDKPLPLKLIEKMLIEKRVEFGL